MAAAAGPYSIFARFSASFILPCQPLPVALDLAITSGSGRMEICRAALPRAGGHGCA